MNTSLRFTLILLLAAGLSFAQDSTRIGVQSNLASLARPAIPSLNLGLMIEKGHRQYTIELDMGLFTPRSRGQSPEEQMMNGFTSQNRFTSSVDVTGGVHWFFNEGKTIYHGLRGNVGYFAYNHRQTLCTEAENKNGICVCNELENHHFNTSHLRFGAHYRIGFIAAINPQNEIEFSFDVGVFGFIRNNTNTMGEHQMCSFLDERTYEQFFPLVEDLFSNVMFDFERNVQPYVRLNLVYRFIL